MEEYSVGSATDLTETSSVVDGDWTMVDENSSTLSLSQAELEHISMELANKGPHKSQVQLRWDAVTKPHFHDYTTVLFHDLTKVEGVSVCLSFDFIVN